MLKTLNLDKNQIRQIPAAVLQGCSLLQALSLHSNPISAQVWCCHYWVYVVCKFDITSGEILQVLRKQHAGVKIMNLIEILNTDSANAIKTINYVGVGRDTRVC